MSNAIIAALAFLGPAKCCELAGMLKLTTGCAREEINRLVRRGSVVKAGMRDGVSVWGVPGSVMPSDRAAAPLPLHGTQKPPHAPSSAPRG